MDSTSIVPRMDYSIRPKGKQIPHSLCILAVYESILACLIADIASKRISNHIGGNVNMMWCSFAKTNKPGFYNYLKSQVNESNLILVAKTDPSAIPQGLVSWLGGLNDQICNDGISILGVFASNSEGDLAQLPSFRSLRSQCSDIGATFYGTSLPLFRNRFGGLQRDFESEPLDQEFADFIQGCRTTPTIEERRTPTSPERQ